MDPVWTASQPFTLSGPVVMSTPRFAHMSIRAVPPVLKDRLGYVPLPFLPASNVASGLPLTNIPTKPALFMSLALHAMHPESTPVPLGAAPTYVWPLGVEVRNATRFEAVALVRSPVMNLPLPDRVRSPDKLTLVPNRFSVSVPRASGRCVLAAVDGCR